VGEHHLKELAGLGQSAWYDYIRRDLYETSELERLIDDDALRGITSNPTIFEKAIATTELYDRSIREHAGGEAAAILESLMLEDVRRCADVFRPLYESIAGDDGFVSIEIGPEFAHDTAGSIAEARRLWRSCERPNVMIKIPATAEGIPAIRQCLADGININITLLFSVQRYEQVIEAYFQAMEERVGAGQPVRALRSVASFFVSRVDTRVDKALEAIDRAEARALMGKAAIANARIAYETFERAFASRRFAALREKGVAVQRPLWASTSTKNPAYPELYYVEALVAPSTVTTLPPETFRAYNERGNPAVRIRDDLDGAHLAVRQLAGFGIDLTRVGEELEEEGVRKFVESQRGLRQAIETRLAALVS
jgi:transaldolase